MSNYTKSTNFATKDNLTPGDPLKVVRGTEIDTEFNNIATAVATKTDNSAAAITGGSITGITDLAIADGGTGASTATAALNNLLPSQTGNSSKYLQTDGTNATWDAISINTGDITGTLPVANGGTGVTSSTGTGSVVLSNSPTLVTPALGTPASGVATNLTGLPISTGVSGLGTGVATFLGTPSSANLASAVSDETGTGSLVFANSPTLVTPALGTPSALVGTNITGTASGLTAGNVTTNANLTGAVTSVGNATSLGSFSSANLLGALTDETGTGSAVFATSPTLVTPVLGTPTSATLTNATGLPLTTGVTGTLPTANGGTNLTSFTSGGVVYASSTSALATGSALTFDGSTFAVTGEFSATKSQNATSTFGFSNNDTTNTSSRNQVNFTAGNRALTFLTINGDHSYLNTTGAGNLYLGTGGTIVTTLTQTSLYTASGINVGIGTSSPAYKLQVVGGAISASRARSNTAGDMALQIAPSDSTVQYGFRIDSNNNNLNLDYYTGSGYTTRAVLDNAGNLGFGVTPSGSTSNYRTLQIGGSAQFSIFGQRVSGSCETFVGWNAYGGSNTTSIGTGFYYVNTGDAATMYSQNAQHVWWNAPSGTAGNAISFTQAMTLSASGGLGVGETSIASDTRLHLKHTTDNCLLKIQSSYSPILRLINGGGSEVSTIDATGNNVLTFQTGSTERARIDSSGNFFIGTTSGTSKLNVTTTTASGAAITFDGNVGNGILMKTTYASATGGTYISFANSDGTATGNISQTGTTTVAYATSSDYRLKENIAPMIGALATVAQLKPCTYTWKSNGSSGQGFIAHELQSVVSDAVVGEKDAVDSDGNPKYQGIDTSFLVATLTAALQEQQAIIESLKARLDAANL